MDYSLKRRHIEMLVAVSSLSCSLDVSAAARGVSPYLPLNLAPEIERQIERVLILGDKPIMHRPIAAATVLDALPKACEHDARLCEEVRQYLERYMYPSNLTELRGEAAVTGGKSDKPIPNEHGLKVDDAWSVTANAYYQPSDYLLLNAGALAYSGRVAATGSVVSIGFDVAQLDIGMRDHWFSPLTDSSMLMSTEAPTMPSVTLSNYRPITSLGITYELFLAKMSRQDGIAYYDTTTSGNPHLTGLQIGIEPVSGYALAVNRVLQFGGGARGGASFHELYNALFYNSSANNTDSPTHGLEFGHQEASVTSSILFPGRTPFAVHVEYAGNDNAYAGNKYLGETDLSLGIDFPKLWNDYDLTYEVSEWQNTWYTHHLYPLGVTNDGLVTGHWFGDERVFNNAIGGHSQMLRLGWRWRSTDYLQATYRNLVYDSAWAGSGALLVPYRPLNELGINYSTSWRGHPIGAELFVGRDVFGKSFVRLAGSVDIAPTPASDFSASAARDGEASDTDVFVDMGVNVSHVRKILAVDIPNSTTPFQSNYHLGFGARRRVSDYSDVGARLELDQVDGHDLLSLRAVDYRYRLNRNLALGGFFGVGRYEIGLPAYGWYMGGGIQYMNLFKDWDLGLDIRRHEKLGRDKVLPNDPPSTPDRTREFFDVTGAVAYLTRRF